MDFSGEYTIPAPRKRVWDALNDPEVLKQAIPGCDELNKTSDTDLEAKVTAKVGPVKAKFGGNVRLEDINAPVSYRIVGEGKGGAAGFAKGGAHVNLEEVEGGTLLRYQAQAEVGGKLAQIGSRLIQGTAKKMADQFFGKFSDVVTALEAANPTPVEAPAPAAEPDPMPLSAATPASGQPDQQATATSQTEPSPHAEPAGQVEPAAQSAIEFQLQPVSQPAAPVEAAPEPPPQQVAAVEPERAPAAQAAAVPSPESQQQARDTEPQMPMAEAKKSNTGLWIGVVAVILVLAYFIFV